MEREIQLVHPILLNSAGSDEDCEADHSKTLDVSTSLNQACFVGDLDNDGLNEFCVGDISGRLDVYKNACRKWTFTVPGSITCMTCGPILPKPNETSNIAEKSIYSGNSVAVLTAEGMLYVFHHRKDGSDYLKMVLSESIPLNASTITTLELLLPIEPEDDEYIEIPGQRVVQKQVQVTPRLQTVLIVGTIDRMILSYVIVECDEEESNGFDYKLVLVASWTAPEQIHSMEVVQWPTSTGSESVLLVGQYGGRYLCLSSNGRILPFESKSLHTSKFVGPSLFCSAVSENESVIVQSSLDGRVLLQASDSSYFGELNTIKSVYVKNKLFSSHLLDVTGDGSLDILTCSWDGSTYFIDSQMGVTKFSFGEPVNIFCVGMYAVSTEDRASPCLFYRTVCGKLLLYPDVNLPYIGPQSLLSPVGGQKNPVVSRIKKSSLLQQPLSDSADEREGKESKSSSHFDIFHRSTTAYAELLDILLYDRAWSCE